MLLEKRLHQLAIGAEKEMMSSQLNILKERAEAKLNTVSGHFPHFSKHDVTHSQTIATYIGNLLGEDRVNKLSYSDILMMLLSFYYHDIGMALEYEEIYNYFHGEEFQKILSQYAGDPLSELFDVACRLQKFGTTGAKDYETSIDVYNDVILVIEDTYRSNHAQRSAEAIMKDDYLGSVLHARCQRILGDICAIHQKPISDIMNLQRKENGFFGDYFHPRLIAAMLCLGDLLDLDTDRFDEVAIRSSSPLPRLSKLHMEKHKSIRHFLVDKGTIEISADMTQVEVYRVMRKWTDWIQEACDFIALHWSEIAPEDFGNAPKIVKCDLLLNGNTKWLPFSNTRYVISDKRMFELLKGSKIYRDKFVCIREIIQNAIDATLLRLFDEDILSGDEATVLKQLKALKWDDFQITGELNILDDTHIGVSLRDRGIGISVGDIGKIANVSNIASAKREALISKMPMWLRPSGAFGMGLQSVFLLADQFEVITKTANEAAKKIVFQSAVASDGYITVEDYNEPFSQGTKISFVINGEKLSSAELGCSNYHYKQKKLTRFIFQEILSKYDNQRENVIPFDRVRRKTTDYVPVEIIWKTPENVPLQPLLVYRPIFCSEESAKKQVEIGNGFIDVQKFIPELNCIISCRVHLTNRPPKKQDHLYGYLHNLEQYYYHNAVFYRNAYVQDEVFHHSFAGKAPIISYMDWRINLLDATANEVLKISRDSINADYAGTFYMKLNHALELAAKDAIDYLIDDSPKQEQGLLGDTALILCQFAIQLHHRENELIAKFGHILNQVNIDNYYRWASDEHSEESVIMNAGKLRNCKLYLIADQMEHVPDGIQGQALDSDKCLHLKGKYSGHILDHRVMRIFLGQIDGKYVKTVEAIPFECNTPDQLYELDDIFFLENLVRMIALNSRVIPALSDYKMLITPITPTSDMFWYGHRNEQYYIESPFEGQLEEMRTALYSNGFIPDAVNEYRDKIVDSALFCTNVEYIADITGESPSRIRKKYIQFVEKCLKLLSDKTYKEFNLDVLKKADAEREANYTRPDVIDLNPYISYRDIRLSCY